VVAERCFLSRPALSSVMQTLERRGYLTRRVHGEDRRRVLVDITAEGLATMARVLPELHRAEAEWLGPVPAEERERLLEALGAIQARMDATART
jgi:DNA-binding MarR family transcriptional regulator